MFEKQNNGSDMGQKATLYQRWGSRIEGWMRRQIARNDLGKNFDAFSSEMEKESFPEEKSFSEIGKTIFKEENTCDGVDDQKQVAGGESGTLKGGQITSSMIHRNSVKCFAK